MNSQLEEIRTVAAANGFSENHPEKSLSSSSENSAEAIDRLAALSTLEYAQARSEEGVKLGVSLKFLDKAVAEVRTHNGSGKAGQGSELTFREILPAQDSVKGNELLAAILAVVTRYLVLPKGASLTIALWVLRTFAHDLFEINPRLAVRSPEKQCGKTTLLELLSMIVPKPLLSSNCTPSSLFRLIEKCQPTLLIDEMDTFQDGDEALRGILNSGHTRAAARVIRNVGDQHEPRVFTTWAPMALAAIGKLPDTLEDRSLRIDLQRNQKTDQVQRFPRKGPPLHTLQKEIEDLQSQCVRWIADHSTQIANVDSPILPELSDRANDNWSPLLSIAKVIGEGWHEKATQAAVTISGEHTDSETIGVLLLGDLKEIFEKKGDKAFSQDLCDALAQLDERPWASWRKGKPISTNNLARLLKPYGISSQTLRLENDTAKGYHKDHFLESWGRYCVSRIEDHDSNRHTVTRCMDTGQPPLSSTVTENTCDVSEYATLANVDRECDGVTDENPESRTTHTQEVLHLDV